MAAVTSSFRNLFTEPALSLSPGSHWVRPRCCNHAPGAKTPRYIVQCNAITLSDFPIAVLCFPISYVNLHHLQCTDPRYTHTWSGYCRKDNRSMQELIKKKNCCKQSKECKAIYHNWFAVLGEMEELKL